MKVLLIEPDYKNKYPPLGLMKISTFHKNRGDEVIFCKGLNEDIRNTIYDRIYIASLFTFYYDKTIETIKFYYDSVKNSKDIFLGGVCASLKQEDFKNEFNITVVPGLLNESKKIGLKSDHEIDALVPDYNIIDTNYNQLLTYEYPIKDSYIAYASRGCIRKCKFCAVPILEGKFSNTLSIFNQVNNIKNSYGNMKNLMLLDNNILALEDHFFDVIEEIKALGFEKDAKLKRTNKFGKEVYLKRKVDFNQGIDARLLVKNERYIEAISEIAIDPLRIAFDDLKDKDVYVRSVRLAAKFGIKVMSNYLLYNYKDSPKDFYERLRINIELNEEFKSNGFNSRIWSFPMKFSPIFGANSTNRTHVGPGWTKKELRGIQNILSSTHGVVGPRKPFFEVAFGKNFNEFQEILFLPERYIIHRKKFIDNGYREKLINMINSLDKIDRVKLFEKISTNSFKDYIEFSNNPVIERILKEYYIKKN